MRLTSFLTIIPSIILLPCVLSCGKTPATPSGKDDPTPVVETTMKGSFDSKWNRYSEGQIHKGQTDEKFIEKEWKDTLWLGDRAHKQLILWTEEKPVRGISVDVSDLNSGGSQISASNISVRYEKYVTGDEHTATCGKASSRVSVKIADALTEAPVTGFTATDPLKLWLTVNIPSNAVPGLYTGKIEIRKNKEVLDTYNLSFLIVNRVLPDVSEWKFYLDIWQFPFQLPALCKKSGKSVEPFGEDYFKLVKPFYTILADAGQKAITTYIKDGAFGRGQTMVDWKLNKSGGWEFDFTKFDAYVDFMMNLGIDKQIDCFSLYGWDLSIGYLDMNDGQSKRVSYDINDEQYAKIWNKFLLEFKAHLTAKGWFDKTVLYMDEIPEPQLNTLVSLIKANDPDWKIGSAGSWYAYTLTEQLYEQAPIISCTDKSGAQRVLFYTSCSQEYPNNYVTKDNSLAEMSYMAWYALANGYDGFLRWAFDYWYNADPMNAQDGSNAAGDNHFIYRSSNDFSTCTPIASTRLEILRDGIQNYEKAMILGKNKFSEVTGLFRYSEHPDAEKAVSKAEKLLKQLSVTQ